MRFLSSLRRVVVTVWAGSLWTVGYLVAPVLFATLPERSLAGTIAGNMFRAETWVSIVCAVILLGLLAVPVRAAGRAQSDGGVAEWLGTRKLLVTVVLAMLVCTLIGYFGLQPAVAAIRDAAGPGGLQDEAMRERFGLLHGLSSGLYLLQSLLALLLVWKAK